MLFASQCYFVCRGITTNETINWHRYAYLRVSDGKGGLFISSSLPLLSHLSSYSSFLTPLSLLKTQKQEGKACMIWVLFAIGSNFVAFLRELIGLFLTPLPLSRCLSPCPPIRKFEGKKKKKEKRIVDKLKNHVFGFCFVLFYFVCLFLYHFIEDLKETPQDSQRVSLSTGPKKSSFLHTNSFFF